MTTRAPNEQTPGQPEADNERNDVAIDPQGRGQGNPAIDEFGNEGDSSTAEGNEFSPDFEPEDDEEKLIKPKDADIDTDGG